MEKFNEINTKYILWLLTKDYVTTDANNLNSKCKNIKDDPANKIPLLYNKIALYAIENNISINTRENDNTIKKYFIVNYGLAKYEIGISISERNISYYAKRNEIEDSNIKLNEVINSSKEIKAKVKRLSLKL